MPSKQPLTPKDLQVLRDACQHYYHHLNKKSLDEDLPWQLRPVIEQMADEVMSAWTNLPTEAE